MDVVDRREAVHVDEQQRGGLAAPRQRGQSVRRLALPGGRVEQPGLAVRPGGRLELLLQQAALRHEHGRERDDHQDVRVARARGGEQAEAELDGFHLDVARLDEQPPPGLLAVDGLDGEDDERAGGGGSGDPQFGSFLLSFVVIARAWLFHHRLLERVTGYDEAFLLINLAWVLTVVVRPFSTQVVAGFSTQRLSFAIYIGTITLNSACSTALTLLVHRRPALPRAGEEAAGRGPLTARVATGTVVLALVLGVAVPAVNFYALLLLLAGPLLRLADRVHPQP